MGYCGADQFHLSWGEEGLSPCAVDTVLSVFAAGFLASTIPRLCWLPLSRDNYIPLNKLWVGLQILFSLMGMAAGALQLMTHSQLAEGLAPYDVAAQSLLCVCWCVCLAHCVADDMHNRKNPGILYAFWFFALLRQVLDCLAWATDQGWRKGTAGGTPALLTATAHMVAPVGCMVVSGYIWRQRYLHYKAYTPIPDTVNPFEYNSPVGLVEGLQIAISSLVLLPIIRLVLVFFVFFVGWIWACLCTYSFKKYTADEISVRRLSKWRRYLFWIPAYIVGRIILFILGFYYIRFNTPEGYWRMWWEGTLPNIIVCNHVAVFDGLLLALQLRVCAITKASIRNVPFLGSLMEAMQFVFVERSTPEQRQRVLQIIDTRAHAPPGAYPPLLIFPEGTTKNQASLIMFKKGAFVPGVPVQPITIKYYNGMYDPSFVSEGETMFSMWRMLCQWFMFIRIEFLPPYIPSEEERADPILYANNVRHVMAQSLNVAVTDHCFEDYLLYAAARRRGDNIETTKVNVTELKQLYDGFTLDTAKSLLERFDHMSSGGYINPEQFAEGVFGAPLDPHIQEIFNFFDIDEDGLIDFRDFCIALLSCSPKASTDDRLELAFQIYDQSHQGTIGRADLRRILLGASTMGSSVTAARIDTFLDANGVREDSKIDLEEFKCMAARDDRLTTTALSHINEAYAANQRRPTVFFPFHTPHLGLRLSRMSSAMSTPSLSTLPRMSEEEIATSAPVDSKV